MARPFYLCMRDGERASCVSVPVQRERKQGGNGRGAKADRRFASATAVPGHHLASYYCVLPTRKGREKRGEITIIAASEGAKEKLGRRKEGREWGSVIRAEEVRWKENTDFRRMGLTALI